MLETNLNYFRRFSERVAKLLSTYKMKSEEQELSSTIIHQKDLYETHTYVFYGLESEVYRLSKAWLHEHKDHLLIFLEDDMETLAHFINNPRSEEILKDRQVYILPFDFQHLDEIEPYLIQVSPDWVFRQSKKYSETKREQAQAMIQVLIPYIRKAQRKLFTMESFELAKNFIFNLLYLPNCLVTADLFQNWPKKPLALCGAGVSLQEEIVNLKKNRQHLILGGVGTGINHLNQAGLSIDIGFALDPNVTETERIKGQSSYCAPYFVDLHLHYEAFEYLAGPKLLTFSEKMRPWKEEILKKLKVKKEISFAWFASTTHYAAQIAKTLGSKPILLFGIDLSRYLGRAYGAENTWKLGEIYIEPTVEIKIDEKIYETTATFLIEREWLGQFAMELGKNGIYNTSKKGIPIPHVACIDFKKWSEEHLVEEFDAENWIHSAIFAEPTINVSFQEIKEVLTDFLFHLSKQNSAHPIVALLLKDLKESLEWKFAAKRKYSLYVTKDVNIDTLVKTIYQNLISFYLKILREALRKTIDVAPIRAPKKPLKVVQNQNRFITEDGKILAERHPDKNMQYYYSGAIYLEQDSEGSKYYFENGQLLLELSKEGYLALYYSNGQLKMRGAFKQGQKEGSFEFYSPKGEKLNSQYFVRGLPSEEEIEIQELLNKLQ